MSAAGNVMFVGFVGRTVFTPHITMLNQDDLQRWRDCPRRYWLHRHAATSAPTPVPTARASTDTRAFDDDRTPMQALPDQALRASFPEAIVIDAPDGPQAWDRAIAQTQALLDKGYLVGASASASAGKNTGAGSGAITSETGGRAILGACLRSNDGVQVRIDVLNAGAHGLTLFKVRYATVGTQADVDTVALWAHVVARSGLRLQSAGLMLVDTDFIYPGYGCYAGLFREVDLSLVLGARNVPAWLVDMHACGRETMPDASPTASCQTQGACEFHADCAMPATPSKGLGLSPASLDIVGRELALELLAEGHTDLLTVPEERMPDGRRLRALRAVQNNMPVLHANAAKTLKALPYPRHTLRMDTIGFATPIWPGTRPYQVLPFQWTCDVETKPGTLVRRCFLADQHTGDPRRAFAESLLEAVGHHGAIMAYNAGFERNRIRELAAQFEDLATDLECLQPRIVDLFQLTRAHYYHPAMCGSWSFKSVCRAVAPDLRADEFDWAGETAPQAAFARSQTEKLGVSDLQALRQALVAHGQRQTEALRRMVTLFESATARR